MTSRLNLFAIGLGFIALISSFIIVYIAYKNSIDKAEKNLHQFYSDKAQFIHSIIVLNKAKPEKELLQIIEQSYKFGIKHPDDEYVCITDENSILILHTQHPQTIGNYVGNNLILGNEKEKCTLHELAIDKKNYTGNYISSSGQKQIAAFVYVPSLNWTIGVHRSKEQLINEVRSQYNWLVLAFIIICGLLLPLSLGLLFWASRISFKRKLAMEKNNQKQLIINNNLIKESKERAEESENKFKKLSNLTYEGILLHNKGVVVECNHSLLKMIGYSFNEIKGKNFVDLVFPEKYHSLVNEKISQDEVEPYEVELIRKNGSRFPVEIEAREASYNNESIRVAAIRDISERKKAQATILESQQKLSLHIEHTPLGVIEWDMDFNVLSWNKSAEKIFGYTFIEAKGKHVSFIIPEFAKEHVNKILNELLLDKRSNQNTNDNIKKNGEVVTCHWYNTPLINNDGDVIVVASLVQDVTLQKENELALNNKNTELEEAEEKLQAYNEELLSTNQALKENMNALENAREKAEENDKLKSAFLANMSHEIRTPLNGINGFVELLKTPDINEDKRNKYIDIIEHSSIQLLSIIDDILDISKIESDQIIIHKKHTAINQILSDQYAFFIQQANSKNIKLLYNTELTEAKSTINCDEKRITQILSNFINNALKFTESGNVEFGYKLKNGFLEFFVKDTGIGISKENHVKIFHRFRQIDSGHSRSYGGNGLGLAISKALVNKMGGKVWIESKLGQGSIFYFTIPYAPLHLAEENSFRINDSNVINPNWSGKTILIAEDEYTNYMLIEEFFSSTNIILLHAKNGKEAIDYCKSNNQIDLIIMDIKMPVMDGYEAAMLIKKHYPNLPIIAQTAYAMLEDEEKVKRAGFANYITKPIDREKLFEIIETSFKTIKNNPLSFTVE